LPCFGDESMPELLARAAVMAAEIGIQASTPVALSLQQEELDATTCAAAQNHGDGVEEKAAADLPVCCEPTQNPFIGPELFFIDEPHWGLSTLIRDNRYAETLCCVWEY